MSIKDLNKSDLWFTQDGDFLIDGSGDLKDTKDSGDKLESIKQTILHRIIAERNGWRLHPDIQAGLERFLGTTVDKQLLEQMEFEIRRALTSDGILTRDDFIIQAMELTQGHVVVSIWLTAPGQQQPVITIAYSIQSNKVIRAR